MPSVRIVCDSTAEMDPRYGDEHGVICVPLRVLFGDEVLVDGVDVDPGSFYARMRASSRNPTTSQPTPAEFEAAFSEAARDGSSVICTTLSSEMSGTYNAAVTARDALPDLDIHVVDTRTVSMGHHALVRAAVERAEAGGDVHDVLGLMEEVMRRQRSIFTVSTLEYLRRGGRIGGARALLGSVLNIKPVLQVLDGRIEPFDRVRTYQRALERIAGTVAAAVGETGRRAVVAVGHADCPEDARLLAEKVAPHCVGDPEITPIGPIVGCHAGPGTLGLAFHIAL